MSRPTVQQLQAYNPADFAPVGVEVELVVRLTDSEGFPIAEARFDAGPGSSYDPRESFAQQLGPMTYRLIDDAAEALTPAADRAVFGR